MANGTDGQQNLTNSMEVKSDQNQSRLDVGLLDLIAINIGFYLICVFTLGLGLPFAIVMKEKWRCQRTYINGRKLKFVGTASELFVEYIKWVILIIITLGFYTIWLPNKMYQWTLSHTHFEDTDPKEYNSNFTGGIFDSFLTNLVSSLMIIFTLGIAIPWAVTFKRRWLESHSYIDGKQLAFVGTGISLFSTFIGWILLSIITFGIYSLWVGLNFTKWLARNRTLSTSTIVSVPIYKTIFATLAAHKTAVIITSIVVAVSIGSVVGISQFINMISSTYTVTWKNYDGSLLETDTGVPYGVHPIYDGATPEKAGDEQNSFVFNGWSPSINPVRGNQIYTAQYNSTIREYQVLWMDYNGIYLEVDYVPYGTIPTFDGDIPTRSGNQELSFTFAGWLPQVTPVHDSQIYMAQYSSSIRSYTITWMNDDNTVLEIDYNVPYATFPTYDGDTPTKAQDDEFEYTFTGWSPEVDGVTGDQTYVAQYSTAYRNFTVTWKNYDGTVLETDSDVPYGYFPTYDGATPTKPQDGEHPYIFRGWSPSISSVTTDIVYFAEFIPNKIQLGTYPQSEVTDSTLISNLNNAASDLQMSTDNQALIDYDYYIEGSISSYMWYIDVTYGGNEYRGVYFSSYRPYTTTITSLTTNSYQDENGYHPANVYWFKFEPITWRVLAAQTGEAVLMANLVLDSQDYHYSTSMRTIGGTTVYSNNYKESHIRSWLNDNFYNTAFSSEEQGRIQKTNVDNSAFSTGYNPNQYASANTDDKVFLLSYAEATSAAYGLSTNASRLLAPSDYAKSQGVYTYNKFNRWWLRSPNYNTEYITRYVSNDGRVIYESQVTFTYTGVVPAMRISL